MDSNPTVKPLIAPENKEHTGIKYIKLAMILTYCDGDISIPLSAERDSFFSATMQG